MLTPILCPRCAHRPGYKRYGGLCTACDGLTGARTRRGARARAGRAPYRKARDGDMRGRAPDDGSAAAHGQPAADDGDDLLDLRGGGAAAVPAQQLGAERRAVPPLRDGDVPGVRPIVQPAPAQREHEVLQPGVRGVAPDGGGQDAASAALPGLRTLYCNACGAPFAVEPHQDYRRCCSRGCNLRLVALGRKGRAPTRQDARILDLLRDWGGMASLGQLAHALYGQAGASERLATKAALSRLRNRWAPYGLEVAYLRHRRAVVGVWLLTNPFGAEAPR